MTTIIWSENKLMVDTRVTYLQQENGTYKKVSHTDNAVKLFEPQHIRIDNDPVLAIAVTGDMRWVKTLMEADMMGANIDGGINLKEPHAFDGVHANIPDLLETHLVMVTRRRIFMLALHKEGEVWTETMPYNQVAAGTDLHNAVKIVALVSPFLVMESAMRNDDYTGGDVLVWEYGKQGTKTYSVKTQSFFKLRFAVSRASNAIRKFSKLFKLVAINHAMKQQATRA